MESVRLNDLAAATGGRPVNVTDGNRGFDHVGTDSRSVRAGEVFWSIRGATHDGHDYVDEAVRRGAIACVVNKQHQDATAGPRIVVKDTLEALHQFAAWYRARMDALIVGVTGSVGKTTTREMVHAALSAGHRGIRSPKNYNNHVGLPITLLQLKQEHEYAVVELGASQRGEIAQLAAVAAPEVGIVTAIGPAHLEHFGSEQAIAEAKGELVESLPQSGFAVLAGDDPAVRELAKRADCRVLFIGEKSDNTLRATHVDVRETDMVVRVDGDAYRIPAAGRHFVTSALCAIAVGREIGMAAEAIAAGLETFTPAPGRCQVQQIGPWTVIDDTYNANPSSAAAACHVLKSWTSPGRRVLVTGDMRELGGQAVVCHRELGELAAQSDIDFLLAYGDHAGDVVKGALGAGMDSHRLASCDSMESLLAVLDCCLEPGDVILAKGSRSLKMERVVDWLKQQNEPCPAKLACESTWRAVA